MFALNLFLGLLVSKKTNKETKTNFNSCTDKLLEWGFRYLVFHYLATNFHVHSGKLLHASNTQTLISVKNFFFRSFTFAHNTEPSYKNICNALK